MSQIEAVPAGNSSMSPRGSIRKRNSMLEVPMPNRAVSQQMSIAQQVHDSFYNPVPESVLVGVKADMDFFADCVPGEEYQMGQHPGGIYTKTTNDEGKTERKYVFYIPSGTTIPNVYPTSDPNVFTTTPYYVKNNKFCC